MNTADEFGHGLEVQLVKTMSALGFEMRNLQLSL